MRKKDKKFLDFFLEIKVAILSIRSILKSIRKVKQRASTSVFEFENIVHDVVNGAKI